MRPTASARRSFAVRSSASWNEENWSEACAEACVASLDCASAFDCPNAAETRTATTKSALCMPHLVCRSELHTRWVFLQGWLDLPVPFPNGIDRRINHKFHQERGNDAAHHGCGDSLHHIGPTSRGPHERQQAEQHASHRHHLGTKPFDGAIHDGLAQIIPIAHLALTDSVV